MFVGDVMGRGVAAAAAMAQMRAAIRALVAVDPDPAAVLGRSTGSSTTTTSTSSSPSCTPSRTRRATTSCRNAGHPPPVCYGARRDRRGGRREPGLLLGAGGGERAPIDGCRFGRGDLFLAYTDGLVERRDEDIEAGVQRLAGGLPGRRGRRPLHLARRRGARGPRHPP